MASSDEGEPLDGPAMGGELDAAADVDDVGQQGEAEGGKSGLLHESIRRMLLGGASALLTTEEGIRSLIADRRLPKEALQALLAQTDKTRRDLQGLLGREIKQTLQRMDVAGELRRALTGLRLDITASIRVHDEQAAARSATGSPVAAEEKAAADDLASQPPAG